MFILCTYIHIYSCDGLEQNEIDAIKENIEKMSKSAENSHLKYKTIKTCTIVQ